MFGRAPSTFLGSQPLQLRIFPSETLLAMLESFPIAFCFATVFEIVVKTVILVAKRLMQGLQAALFAFAFSPEQSS